MIHCGLVLNTVSDVLKQMTTQTVSSTSVDLGSVTSNDTLEAANVDNTTRVGQFANRIDEFRRRFLTDSLSTVPSDGDQG